MFARYFFIFVGIISLLWIGYVAFDIIDKKNAYSPTTLFGKEDGELLIINRKNEVDRALIPFKTTDKNTQLLNSLLPNLQDERSVFISSKRSHFLIESRFHWSKEKIKQLFSSSGLAIQSQNIKSITIEGYEVNFHKKYLYFHLESFPVTKMADWSKFDKKSSVSLIKFNNEESASITDIYFKSENTVEYHSKNENQIKGEQINDKDLFSGVLPASIDNYHFYEKTFLSNFDEVFKQGPMYQWLDKGFVSVIYKGQQVLICDYTLGQDPINILYEQIKKDTDNKDNAHFSKIKLTSTFPKNDQTGFFIYNLNDYVVISENQAVCEEIVKENKLGNTLATNSVLLSNLFMGLPKLVSERVINSNEKFSKTIYKSKILETRIPTKVKQAKPIAQEISSSISMNVNASVFDFITFDGKGNCLTLTSTGELLNFSNGKLSWKKEFPGKIIGKIERLDALESVLITNSQAIHLLDRKGNYLWGGPIEIQGQIPIQSATYYEWKGKKYFVYPSENGDLIIYDQNKKKRTSIKSNLSDISAPVDVWVSQNKLFFGVRNTSMFKMIHVDKKKEFRSFALPNASNSVVKGNEIKLFSSESSKLLLIDQKGNKNKLNYTVSENLDKIVNAKDEIYFISKIGSTITIFNSETKIIGDFKVDFADIEHVNIKMINGRNYVSVIDGLENNVYLYLLSGKKISDRSFEGSKKTTINSDNNTLILTTIVDNYLIQYIIN